MSWGGINWMLDRIRDEHGMENTALERLLAPMQQELRELERYLNGLPEPGPDEDDTAFQSIVDDDCDFIEDLLGVAFVVSQTHITQVVSRVMRFLKAAANAGKPIAIVACTKESILATCSNLVAGSRFSEVQVVDSFANYFKHRDEWRGDWSKLKGLSQKTAEVIMAVGATQGSTGNFRAGGRALGKGTFMDLGVLHGSIARWRSDLADRLENETKASGLVT